MSFKNSRSHHEQYADIIIVPRICRHNRRSGRFLAELSPAASERINGTDDRMSIQIITIICHQNGVSAASSIRLDEMDTLAYAY